MTHHLYPFSDERSYFFDSMYDHNRLCHGSKTFFRQPNKDQVKLESMFTKIQVLRTSAVGNAWCIGPLCALWPKVWKIFNSKKLKKTWSKMAWNGLKCILNTTLFFIFFFFFWNVENAWVRTSAPNCGIFHIFFDGFPNRKVCYHIIRAAFTHEDIGGYESLIDKYFSAVATIRASK